MWWALLAQAIKGHEQARDDAANGAYKASMLANSPWLTPSAMQMQPVAPANHAGNAFSAMSIGKEGDDKNKEVDDYNDKMKKKQSTGMGMGSSGGQSSPWNLGMSNYFGG